VTFKELREAIKMFPLKELRFDTLDYLECVISVAKAEHLSSILTSFFGKVTKEAREIATPEIAQKMELYGGIRSNQTLYTKTREGRFYYAMFWPWSDETYLTVRLERVKFIP